MEAAIPIVERLGSLGILVLMVWRAPAIVAAIQALLGSVTDKVAQLQSTTLTAFKEQQEAERALFTIRFENIEKGLEKIVVSLDATMKSQTTILQIVNSVYEEQNEIRHRLERLEDKK
jgi:hypothetical protein